VADDGDVRTWRVGGGDHRIRGRRLRANRLVSVLAGPQHGNDERLAQALALQGHNLLGRERENGSVPVDKREDNGVADPGSLETDYLLYCDRCRGRSSG